MKKNTTNSTSRTRGAQHFAVYLCASISTSLFAKVFMGAKSIYVESSYGREVFESLQLQA